MWGSSDRGLPTLNHAYLFGVRRYPDFERRNDLNDLRVHRGTGAPVTGRHPGFRVRELRRQPQLDPSPGRRHRLLGFLRPPVQRQRRGQPGQPGKLSPLGGRHRSADDVIPTDPVDHEQRSSQCSRSPFHHLRASLPPSHFHRPPRTGRPTPVRLLPAPPSPPRQPPPSSLAPNRPASSLVSISVPRPDPASPPSQSPLPAGPSRGPSSRDSQPSTAVSR